MEIATSIKTQKKVMLPQYVKRYSNPNFSVYGNLEEKKNKPKKQTLGMYENHQIFFSVLAWNKSKQEARLGAVWVGF